MHNQAIVGIGKIPKKESSHGYGWARTWSENLNIPIDHSFSKPYDTVYVDHGVNFGGSLNLFGGFDDELKARCDNLMMAQTIYSLDIDMPDYGAMLAKRKDVTDKGWCDKLSAKLKTAKTQHSHELPNYWLAIGDSHTAAYSRMDSGVTKRDGMTLNGQCRSGFDYIKTILAEKEKRDREYDGYSSLEGITMSFGNIDIRHHICRLNTDFKPLLYQWRQFGESLGIDVEYSAPWPIEYEKRKLPKTGYYKGEPFWGSYNERSEIVSEWISEMKSLNMNIVMPPADWYNMNPEKYAKEYMEANSSVHLSPAKYRRKDWGKSALGIFE